MYCLKLFFVFFIQFYVIEVSFIKDNKAFYRPNQNGDLFFMVIYLFISYDMLH